MQFESANRLINQPNTKSKYRPLYLPAPPKNVPFPVFTSLNYSIAFPFVVVLQRVLTMEFIGGCKVTEVDKIKDMGLNPADVSTWKHFPDFVEWRLSINFCYTVLQGNFCIFNIFGFRFWCKSHLDLFLFPTKLCLHFKSISTESSRYLFAFVLKPLLNDALRATMYFPWVDLAHFIWVQPETVNLLFLAINVSLENLSENWKGDKWWFILSIECRIPKLFQLYWSAHCSPILYLFVDWC